MDAGFIFRQSQFSIIRDAGGNTRGLPAGIPVCVVYMIVHKKLRHQNCVDEYLTPVERYVGFWCFLKPGFPINRLTRLEFVSFSVRIFYIWPFSATLELF